MKVPITAITSVVLISYMQCLDANAISPSGMANHILALAIFDDPRISHFLKAMVLTKPFKANKKL